MSTQKQPDFLATKVMVPNMARGLIERPRLLRLIDQIQSKQLTIIKGGAGFGKTSLAAEVAARLQQDGHVVAWLTLDAADSDPSRFLLYVAQALRRACGMGATSIKLISELVTPETIATNLANELVDVEEDIYLVLDDYHLIDDAEVHAVLSFLFKHAPNQFHLVLATRTEPPLPIAGIRVQNKLLEIDAAILRFDLDETLLLLQHENIVATAAEAKLLKEKTDGWPALLRIFCLVAGKSSQSFAESLRQLSGNLSPIGTYLDEILDGLPRPLVEFMLRTAILERFSVPLCEAVTGAKSSQAFIDIILARQLLCSPIDREGQWFRYHPILAEHLNRRLIKEFSAEIPWLHRHAYYWYASNESWTEAIQHAIAAGDVDQAIAWIKKFAMDLVRAGNLLTLMDWRRLFPTELMRGQVEARVAIAWGMALAMRFNETLELIDALGSELDRSEMEPATRDAMACECDAIRAVTFALKDDSQAGLTLAESCLRRTSDHWTANVASNVARFGYLKAADLKGFYATPWIPYSQTEDRLNLFASVYHRCLLGIAEFQQLHIQTAERHYTESMRLAELYTGPESVAAALPASLLALLRYEQGRLSEAETLVIDRVPLITGAGMLECGLSTLLTLARVAEWRGNFERARAILEQGEAHGYERGWERLIAFVLTEQIRLDLAEGRIAEAGAHLDKIDRLARETSAASLCARSDIQNYASLAHARVAAADNRLGESIDLLASLHGAYESAQNHLAALRVGPHLAVALWRADESARALTVFRDVVSASAAAQIGQPILEAGLPIGPLLHRTAEELQRPNGNHQLSGYLQTILSRWRERYQHDGDIDSASATLDALSTRERSILERVGQGQSNKEIAKELFISPETVKSHIKNIFTKLDVEKRAQAVARAQSLGLVSTPL